MEIIAVIQGIVFLAFLVFLYKHYQTDKEKTEINLQILGDSLRQSLDSVARQAEKYYEMSTKTQEAHYKNLEKVSTEQLEMLNKQAKEFLGAMQIKKDEITEFINNEKKFVPIQPDLTINKTENSIEITEPLEIPLDQLNRIPILNGVNVKFEGEEQVLPININP